MDLLPETFWLQPKSLENDIMNTVLLWGESMWISQCLIFLFPRLLGILWSFFFLYHLRYLRDHLLSFFSYLQPHLSHSEDLEDVPI